MSRVKLLWFWACTNAWAAFVLRPLADLGLPHEGGTFFDGQRASGYVADEDCIGLEFATLLDGDVAFNFAKDSHRAGLDFSFDQSVFTNGEATVRMDFAFDFTVDDKVVGELDRAFDFYIIGQDIFAR